MAKVVTYTAIIGDYDKLYEPYFKTPDTEMVCFTDNPRLISDNWKIVLVDRPLGDPVRCARRLKVLSHRLFPEANITIWVDGNLELLKAIDIGTASMLVSNRAVSAYHHCVRKDVMSEAEFCSDKGLDNARVIWHQMAQYREEGFPDDVGLAHTSFLVRRNVPEATMFNEAWWREIENGSRRDQLSFDYCRWRLGVEMSWIRGSIYDGVFFLQRKHK